MNLIFKLWALGNKLFTKKKKKKLGRIFNCILMMCNLAKKKRKGDVTFRLTFLNGTLHTPRALDFVSQHLYDNEQPCWFLTVCCGRLS